ncbi:hypothetical protein [Ornithinimicrobium panacihumi]|uniref:hypothetical protein n=1 Tax=Ornithinimicrobium panacihumi TaxID=2008449 RepID=UPI003F89EF78
MDGDWQGSERVEEDAGTTYLPVRRRPSLSRFVISGALLGFIIGGLVGFFGPDAPNSSLTQEVILLGMVGALLTGALAVVAYLVADRSSQRGS